MDPRVGQLKASSSAVLSESNLCDPPVLGAVSSTPNLATGLKTKLGSALTVCDPPALSVVSAGPNLATVQGAELGTPVEVCGPPVSNAEPILIEN